MQIDYLWSQFLVHGLYKNRLGHSVCSIAHSVAPLLYSSHLAFLLSPGFHLMSLSSPYNSLGILPFYLSYVFSLLELFHFSTEYSLELSLILINSYMIQMKLPRKLKCISVMSPYLILTTVSYKPLQGELLCTFCPVLIIPFSANIGLCLFNRFQ